MFAELVSGLGGVLGAGLALFIVFCLLSGVLVGGLLFAMLPFVFLLRPREAV